ncbi:MAG: phosphatidate cytidylyltransferase [Pygmaiobacter sp.]
MKQRIITSVIGIPILLLALYFYQTYLFNIILSAVCMLAFYEIVGAFKIKKPVILYLAIVPMALIVLLSDHAAMRQFVPLLLFFFIIYIAVCVIFEIKELSFVQVSGVVLFCGVVLFGFYSILSFKLYYPASQYNYDALYFIMLGFGYAWGGDSAAYFTGRAFGKHKLAPEVSPNKTIEGAIGGIFGSMVLGVLFTLIYAQLLLRFEPSSFSAIDGQSYLAVCGIGAVASVMGILGDLFTSAIKRQCNIKDYGFIFPGHGGILDRFDSVLFVMPFVLLMSRVFPIIAR